MGILYTICGGKELPLIFGGGLEMRKIKLASIALTALMVGSMMPAGTSNASAKTTSLKSFPKKMRGTWYNKNDNDKEVITAKKWKTYDVGTTSTFVMHPISKKKGTESWIYAFPAKGGFFYDWWPEGKHSLSDFAGPRKHMTVITKKYHGKKIHVLKQYGESDSFAVFSYHTKKQSNKLKSYQYYH